MQNNICAHFQFFDGVIFALNGRHDKDVYSYRLNIGQHGSYTMAYELKLYDFLVD